MTSRSSRGRSLSRVHQTDFEKKVLLAKIELLAEQSFLAARRQAVPRERDSLRMLGRVLLALAHSSREHHEFFERLAIPARSYLAEAQARATHSATGGRSPPLRDSSRAPRCAFGGGMRDEPSRLFERHRSSAQIRPFRKTASFVSSRTIAKDSRCRVDVRRSTGSSGAIRRSGSASTLTWRR